MLVLDLIDSACFCCVDLLHYFCFDHADQNDTCHFRDEKSKKRSKTKIETGESNCALDVNFKLKDIETTWRELLHLSRGYMEIVSSFQRLKPKASLYQDKCFIRENK